jgi:hypothetical protein
VIYFSRGSIFIRFYVGHNFPKGFEILTNPLEIGILAGKYSDFFLQTLKDVVFLMNWFVSSLFKIYYLKKMFSDPLSVSIGSY